MWLSYPKIRLIVIGIIVIFSLVKITTLRIDYDIKQFLRMLYNSEFFQRKAVNSDLIPMGKSVVLPGPALRRMSAEQLWDSMMVLSGGISNGWQYFRSSSLD